MPGRGDAPCRRERGAHPRQAFLNPLSFHPHPTQGVSAPPPETAGFRLQQTMLRIKDPEVSLLFYTGVLGFTLLNKLSFPEKDFDLFFLGFLTDISSIPDDPSDRAAWTFAQPNTLELTFNYGTEAQAGRVYSNGNEEGSKGFGHIGVSVPSVRAACDRFEALGVPFIKKPGAGTMKVR